jgi:hypothetical protein
MKRITRFINHHPIVTKLGPGDAFIWMVRNLIVRRFPLVSALD